MYAWFTYDLLGEMRVSCSRVSVEADELGVFDSLDLHDVMAAKLAANGPDQDGRPRTSTVECRSGPCGQAARTDSAAGTDLTSPAISSHD